MGILPEPDQQEQGFATKRLSCVPYDAVKSWFLIHAGMYILYIYLIIIWAIFEFSEWTTGKIFNNIFRSVNNRSHRGAVLPLHSGPWGHDYATCRPRQSCGPSETLQPVRDPARPVFGQLSRILGILNSFVRVPVGMLLEATAFVVLLLDWWSKICHVKLPVLPTSLAYCKLLFSFPKSRVINFKKFILLLLQTFLHHHGWMDFGLE